MIYVFFKDFVWLNSMLSPINEDYGNLKIKYNSDLEFSSKQFLLSR